MTNEIALGMLIFAYVGLPLIGLLLAYLGRNKCEHEYGPWSEETRSSFRKFDPNHRYDGIPEYDYNIVKRVRTRFCPKCGDVHDVVLSRERVPA